MGLRMSYLMGNGIVFLLDGRGSLCLWPPPPIVQASIISEKKWLEHLLDSHEVYRRYVLVCRMCRNLLLLFMERQLCIRRFFKAHPSLPAHDVVGEAATRDYGSQLVLPLNG